MIRDRFGCPPDYNPGFCDEPEEDMCIRCWKCWCRENAGELDDAANIVGAYVYVSNFME